MAIAVATDGRVATIDDADVLRVLGIAGVEVWRHEISQSIFHAAVAFDARGNLYVNERGTVFSYDRGYELQPNSVAPDQMEGLSPDGLLVRHADPAGIARQVFSGGAQLPLIGTDRGAGLTQASSLAVAPDGDVYAVDHADPAVVRFAADGTFRNVVDNAFGYRPYPTGVAAFPDGDVVTTYSDGRIERRAPHGTLRWSLSGASADGHVPRSPAIGPDGSVWALRSSDAGSTTLVHASSHGRWMASEALPAAMSAYSPRVLGLAIDGQGAFYLAINSGDRPGAMVKLAPSRKIAASFPLPSIDVDVAPDGRIAVVGYDFYRGEVWLLNDEGTMLSRIGARYPPPTSATTAAFSPDSKRLYLADEWATYNVAPGGAIAEVGFQPWDESIPDPATILLTPPAIPPGAQQPSTGGIVFARVTTATVQMGDRGELRLPVACIIAPCIGGVTLRHGGRTVAHGSFSRQARRASAAVRLRPWARRRISHSGRLRTRVTLNADPAVAVDGVTIHR